MKRNKSTNPKYGLNFPCQRNKMCILTVFLLKISGIHLTEIYICSEHNTYIYNVLYTYSTYRLFFKMQYQVAISSVVFSVVTGLIVLKGKDKITLAIIMTQKQPLC